MTKHEETEEHDLSDVLGYLKGAVAEVRHTQRRRADGFPVSVSISVTDAERLIAHVAPPVPETLPENFKAQERDATMMSIAFQEGIRWWKHDQTGDLVTRSELKFIHKESARRYRSHLSALPPETGS